jgi:general secretion pathway protein J
MNARSRGFTLVEMMVALVLVSLMSVAMLQAYRFSQRALGQITRVDGGVREVADVQRLLRRLIEQAYPFEVRQAEGKQRVARGMSGDVSRFAMSAPAPATSGSVGMYRYAFGVGEGTDAGKFEVTWALDRNGATPGDGDAARREMLLEGVESISIAYLELVERGDGTMELNWRNEWLDRDALPALVRVRVDFGPGDSRLWPELVVAPRITADANCVFDVVSQMCRMPE